MDSFYCCTHCPPGCEPKDEHTLPCLICELPWKRNQAWEDILKRIVLMSVETDDMSALAELNAMHELNRKLIEAARELGWDVPAVYNAADIDGLYERMRDTR